MTSSATCGLGDEGLPINVHLVVQYAIHHSKGLWCHLFSNFGQLMEMSKENTASANKVTRNIVDTPALNYFNFDHVAFC